MKRMRLPYAPTTAEGLSLFTQCKDKSRFRTISSVTPHTVCSIYQKLTWIGDLAVTHFIGADMRCVLPKDIFVVSFWFSSIFVSFFLTYNTNSNPIFFNLISNFSFSEPFMTQSKLSVFLLLSSWLINLMELDLKLHLIVDVS
jgi:hypothetical protein